MMFRSLRNRRSQARGWLCCIVVSALYAATCGKASATCGDYLIELGGKPHSMSQAVNPSATDGHDAPLPSCKSGNCKSAPAPLPRESAPVTTFRELATACFGSQDHLSNDRCGWAPVASDVLPAAPFLDAPVPPPRRTLA